MSNFILLTGRLTSDPHMSTVGAKLKAGFMLAVDRPYKKDGKTVTDFIKIDAWEKTADLVDKYCKKGKPIQVQGSLNIDVSEKGGKKEWYTSVRADRIIFVPKDNSEQQQASSGGRPQFNS